MDLAAKVALISGGASGIGRATAHRLAEEGVRVCITDLSEEAGREVAKSVNGTFVQADVGDVEQTDAAFAHCIETFGTVDIAFLNAGIAIGHADIREIDDDLYRKIMRVNLDAVFYGARAAIREMEPRGGGAIVATASLAGLIPFAPDPVYVATKHAVVGLIRSIAPTVEPLGITANCVNPGFTDTNIIDEQIKGIVADLGFPLIPPEQIADAVVHAITCGENGRCWVCQPGREPIAYGFRDVPGPRTPGSEGRRPPEVLGNHATPGAANQ
ncbi:MAG: SDR family oxidoreductase [Actinobacteria bacterium]|nr:SDR family oxidoreductase [Actinomycetota bacterium]